MTTDLLIIQSAHLLLASQNVMPLFILLMLSYDICYNGLSSCYKGFIECIKTVSKEDTMFSSQNKVEGGLIIHFSDCLMSNLVILDCE